MFCSTRMGTAYGVYLVCTGKVRMSVRNLPEPGPGFPGGSLLGLPSTFTGRPYSLTAVTLTESDVLHVPQNQFLELMRERPELCREATDILGREVTFIQGALAERRRQLATANLRGFLLEPGRAARLAFFPFRAILSPPAS